MDNKNKAVNKEVRELVTKLVKLSPFVDGKCKMAAALEADVSVRTIERYLNGEVRQLHMAVKILNAINKNITELSSSPISQRA